MRELLWLCIGIVTGRLGVPFLWHAAYITAIVILLLNSTGWHLITIKV